jgi:hypothetical protein
MAPSKVVITVHVLDNADVLRDFLEWCTSLDVDLILASDFGSTDGSQDILEDFARRKLLKWSLNRERNIEHYDPTAVLARVARDQHGADWVIPCDIDEFLCVEDGPLRAVLDRATADELTVLTIGGGNMTGPRLAPGQSAPRILTLRIVRTAQATADQQLSGEVPFPPIFHEKGVKTAVRAAAFSSYGAGAHTAESAWGRTDARPELRYLHYPLRTFEAYRLKVQHAAEWFVANPQLPAWWGWHWRRLIRVNEAGRLREDWERQFVSPARAAELIADGTCVVDETVANGLARLR